MNEIDAKYVTYIGEFDKSRRDKVRNLKDGLFGLFMSVGGVSVIGAILLIFFYLLYVVFPLIYGASIEKVFSTNGPRSESSLLLDIDEYDEIGLNIYPDGVAIFSTLLDEKIIKSDRLFLFEGPSETITSVATGDPASRVYVVGTSSGRGNLFQAEYELTYPEDERVVIPRINFPSGREPLILDSKGSAIRLISGQFMDERGTVVSVTSDGRLLVTIITVETAFLSEDKEIVYETFQVNDTSKNLTEIRLDVEQRDLVTVSSGGIVALWDVSDPKRSNLVDKASVVKPNEKISAISFLSGGISLVIGTESGSLQQWFAVRDGNNLYTLRKIRDFEPMPTEITNIKPEHFRKAFAVTDKGGNFALYNATANNKVAEVAGLFESLSTLAISPRSRAVLFADSTGQLDLFKVDNEHPEISLSALWGEIWYESRSEPEYVWQSSAANSDFEPKYSLTPLVFGTLKATFYSMLFAVPLAIFGAIYTAYFMSPRMRSIVKPTIEIMAALPTVILGFLAGLWLAPYLEKNLAGFFLMMLFVPSIVFLTSILWPSVPSVIRERVPDGWESLLLVPIVCLGIWSSLALGTVIEIQFFGGNLPHWLNLHHGISYDQRNSIVVGIAIGFAVIPTIFSISEDAVFGVPRSLTMGSLALGATPWQTVTRVILLTASPGIFSAVMIGMGRAVGETMIVLMATGNTPIMDLNIFQGFRALSANIAVEMPESEVNSTHYRILFLAALVLFLSTFFVNTLAEVVRQRLRKKYANL